MIAAGLVSFGGGFAYSWFTRTVPTAQSQTGPESNESMASQEQNWELPQGASGVSGAQAGQSGLSMTEKQLRALVYEIQDNMRKYKDKLESLETEEQRLHTARETVKQDIEKLNSLRVELASMTARLKSERDKLIKSRVEIAQAEKANLISIAATYDRMDEAAASTILTNMCVGEQGGQSRKKVFGGSGSNMDDAVKILHYMGEKSKANVLAEMVNSEPKLAAILCEKLKQISEQG
jgi:flagellar motility protein MotE (MotC chaperone)